MASVIHHMIDALGLEIATIKKRGNSRQIELRGGERLEKTSSFTLYEFPMQEDLPLREDSPIKLLCGKQEIEGTLVSLHEGTLTVSLREDIGQHIPFALIIIDNSFLLERLQARLREVESGEAGFNVDLANKVMHPESAVTGEIDPPVEAMNGHLNEEKRNMIRKALGSDLLFVWGPPGTGKTTALAHVVEGFYRQGLTVLLVSNTNIAVDTALEKVAVQFSDEPEFTKGAIIRLGVAVKPEIRDTEVGDMVEISKVASRLSAGLEERKQQLLGEVKKMEEHIVPPCARHLSC